MNKEELIKFNEYVQSLEDECVKCDELGMFREHNPWDCQPEKYCGACRHALDKTCTLKFKGLRLSEYKQHTDYLVKRITQQP